MDILHTQLAVIQRHLAFVQEDAINWLTYVLVFSWGICLFESYLLCVYAAVSFLEHTLTVMQVAAISALFESSTPFCPRRTLYDRSV